MIPVHSQSPESLKPPTPGSSNTLTISIRSKCPFRGLPRKKQTPSFELFSFSMIVDPMENPMPMATAPSSSCPNSGDALPPQDQSLPSIHAGGEADGGEEEEEEEDLCRICRCGATADDPLHYPCACRGSIKFVHQNCLLQWIKHSSSRQCEVCRHTFAFIPIYAEKAPSRLSLGEQISWIARKIWTGSHFLARLALVLFVWLVIVPFNTSRVWDMVFIKNRRELGGFHWLNSDGTVYYEVSCGLAILLGIIVLSVALVLCSDLMGDGLDDGAFFQGNESFVEIIGMRGPVVNLVKHAVEVQLCIALFLVIVVFLPFSWGRIIMYQMSATRHEVTGHAGDWTMLAVGYLSFLGPCAIIGGLYIVWRFSKEINLSRGIIIKALSACWSSVLRLIRRGFIFMVVLGAFPWVCGWWLDICTMKKVQLQFADINLSLVFSPQRILVCWACGILSLVVIRKFLLIINEELHQRISDFLQIPTDINRIWIREFTNASLHENAYRVILHTGVCMILMVVLIFLPIKLVLYTAPSFFPLNFIVFYSPTGLHWNTIARLLRSRYVSRHYTPSTAFKFLLHHWLSFVGKALDLDDILLPMNGDANGNACTSRFDIVGESQDDQVDSKYQFVFKIAALLVLGLVSLVLLMTALIVVPISLGRAVFSLILWISSFGLGSNDGINFLVGCFIISDGIVAIRSLINFVGSRRILSVVQIAGKWCIIGLKSCALLSISVLIIPLLMGLLANLTIEMPLDVMMDERPVFYFHHMWIMGCVFLTGWIRLVLSDVRDMTFPNWRAKFERVQTDGFSHLRAFWVFREILCPIVFTLLTWLCIPYIFAKGVFPLLGCSMRTNSDVYHFAWFGYLVLSILWYVVKKLYSWLSRLHDRIKDDRYLIGTTLRNYEEEGH